ncbi:hypothetical protein H2198_001860 [Neophaeococcomyces mojaviensis]|uniref:Uncharacterized protein n=1 Tax=Neophaeococcomyces mojaviensis TaxID=3383035 RepID=A0ACC3AFY7_9EURO|nr:hypothetical protein H2198_001860 [Knufia sp. JES_112]
MAFAYEEAKFLIDHCFLPPKLPDKSDEESGAAVLLSQINEAAQIYGRYLGDFERRPWAPIGKSIATWLTVYNGGEMCESNIVDAIRRMPCRCKYSLLYVSTLRLTQQAILLLFIQAQNAAILLTKLETGTKFEVWEVSAKQEDVLLANDALIREFPGRSVEVPTSVMNDRKFVQELGSHLHKLSVESYIPESMEKIQKARQHIEENRQAEHPRLVTEWLFTVLASQGSPSATKGIVKRTHDDVNFLDAEKPWRRSSMLLCCKVAIQLAMLNSPLGDLSHKHYKQFMLCFLSHLSIQLVDSPLSMDYLHVMRAKLARRAAKLGSNMPKFVENICRAAITKISAAVNEQWADVQRREVIQTPSIPTRNSDHTIQLRTSHEQILQFQQQATDEFKQTNEAFIPTASKPFELKPDRLPRPSIFDGTADQLLETLPVFQSWVEKHLEAWRSCSVLDPVSCQELQILIDRFWNAARSCLSPYAELMSGALLTVFELWVALDKMVVQIYPLLFEYSPELPESVLSPLLLPKKTQLIRLHRIETYLQQRHRRKVSSLPSLFGPITLQSYAVRTFDTSSHLQQLQNAIEEQATKNKERLRMEFYQLKAMFDRLTEQAKNMNCDKWWFHEGPKRGTYEHARRCKKCELTKQASRLCIKKFEEPLPAYEAMRKAVVHELQPGKAFAAWRDATWIILHDILSPTMISGEEALQKLGDYYALKDYYSPPRRVSLASIKKPHSETHRFKSLITTAEDAIFLSHAMQHEYYDLSRVGVWTKDREEKFTVARFCQAQIGVSPYSCLIETLRATYTSQNNIIARQSSCPTDLSIHDFLVFGSLRAGSRLQLINLLRSLLSRDLDLWSPATVVMVEQILHEAGETSNPNNHFYRDSHQDLRVASYVDKLLEVVSIMLTRIATNWKETNTANLLRVIVQRILSLSISVNISFQCLDLLRRIRSISLSWATRLATLHADQRSVGTSVATSAEIHRRIVEAALVCRATWSVDEENISHLLLEVNDLSELIACTIYIHDFSKHFETTTDKWLKLCMTRDRVLATKLESVVIRYVDVQPAAFTAAVRLVWPRLDISTNFQPVHDIGDRWWVAHRTDSETMVHYNLFTGQLLVGGKPLSILPEKYTESKLYKQVFGDRLLDVVVSGDTRTEFQSSNLFDGHQVYFGLRDGQVQIFSRSRGCTYVAIDRDLFQSDIPVLLLRHSTPWLCVQSSTIEIRNSEAPWDSAACDWTLFPINKSNALYTMESEKYHLLDNHRGIAQKICSILGSLERGRFIHVMQAKETDNIHVHLPRYRLNFIVNAQGELKCMELAATVSKDQSIRTLHGLKTRLVLQGKGSEMSNPKRWVLIPYGVVNVQHAEPHVSVEIDLEIFDEVIFYQYSIDSTLGHLSSDEVEAHLWKALLHAHTSSCLPDVFTQCTGVEESFTTLKDSLIQTLVPFSTISQQILEQISHLAPPRSFYPPDAKKMQKALWDDKLSFLTQHDLFYEIVCDITCHNYKAQYLHPEADFVIPSYRGNDQDRTLANRAKWQLQKIHRTGFIADEMLPNGDKRYAGRDKEQSRDTDAVFRISKMIVHWEPEQWNAKNIYPMLEQWNSVKGFNCLYSPASLTESLSLSIEDNWPSILTTCLKFDESNRAELLFAMSLMAFGHPESLPHLTTLLHFAVSDKLKDIGLPEDEEYDLAAGNDVSLEVFQAILDECHIYQESHQLRSLKHYNGIIDIEDHFEPETSRQHDIIESCLRAAWEKGEELKLPSDEQFDHFYISNVLLLLNGRLDAWLKNHNFQTHCQAWEAELSRAARPARKYQIISLVMPSMDMNVVQQSAAFPSLLQRMKQSDVSVIASRQPQSTDFDMSIRAKFESMLDQPKRSFDAQYNELELVIKVDKENDDKITKDYKKALLKSISALKSRNQQPFCSHEFPSQKELEGILEWIKDRINVLLGLFQYLCTTRSMAEWGLELAELWPKATTSSLLQLLSKRFRADVPDEWKVLLVGFAREIAARQRIQRLIRFTEARDRFAFQKEVENSAHKTWKLKDNLDWLLLEIQNDILVRPVQISVAREMIKPESGVLQLQMGDGKSSVILPLFCTAVADGERLVRVIVLKSLAKETLRSLSKALSGLVQRPVYWLPFSRNTKVTKQTASDFRTIWRECRRVGGVLLALPEHLNSFRLIGNDQLTAGHNQTAATLLSAQKWLDSNARDVIDESDEVLKPAYELVYTNGEDKPLSGTPYRWTVLLSVLNIVQKCAKDVHARLPHGVEYKENGIGVFATVRILNEEGSAALMDGVMEHIRLGNMATFTLERNDAIVEEAMTSFVRNFYVNSQVHKLAMSDCRSTEEFLAVNLLRGLFACGYLSSALKKRWFVQYGLARERCLSAVPYRARSVPASSEFAQPDMMVLLTALSYYYTGLTIDDIRRALAILVRMPDPDEEYKHWISESTLPENYHSVSALNLQDDICIEEIHEHLQKRKTTIDFFLKTVVLAKESKEYPYKLSSSAWDLCAGQQAKVTSGFSGTCDSIMPDPMPEKDLADLKHFDAAVLIDLLQPRNRRYIYAGSAKGTALDTKDLLKLIGDRAPEASVIIDVGAQILDKNDDVAWMWLCLRPEKLAAVFFDEHDEKMVISSRDGIPVRWVSSPYREQIDKCLIYLDQYHTRGTDFSLPDDFAAAVLLGPGLQKDAWVQGCMRMRKLSFTQSVVMVGSPEVDNDIRTTLAKSPEDVIDSADIIKWTIRQSCQALKSQQSLHLMRGLEFYKRHKAFQKQVSNQGVVKSRASYIDNIRTAETSDVTHLYPVGRNSLAKPPTFSRYERADKDVAELLKKWDEADKVAHWESHKYDEQEREMLHEVEQEREVQRPKSMNPKPPSINKQLQDIILQDRAVQVLPEDVVPAFGLMGNTSLFNELLHQKLPRALVATRDFMETVKSTTNIDLDDHLRPVYWVLKLKLVRQLILIGPHEVQDFLPALRRSTVATLITYSAKTTKEMHSFDDLDVYTIPPCNEPLQVDPDVMSCLRIFAGQLYFSTFEEYERFCILLRLPCNYKARPVSEEVANPASMLRLSNKTSNKLNFVPMIKKWIDMRRKGTEWGHTHVGRVLNGERLELRDFM